MKMLTTNKVQPKPVVRLVQGPALTTNMEIATPRFVDHDPTGEKPRMARLMDGKIMTQANVQELLDNRPEVKAARMAAIKATKSKKRAAKKAK
jgi:hypothetical protein